jgi:hypothetical protein
VKRVRPLFPQIPLCPLLPLSRLAWFRVLSFDAVGDGCGFFTAETQRRARQVAGSAVLTR